MDTGTSTCQVGWFGWFGDVGDMVEDVGGYGLELVGWTWRGEISGKEGEGEGGPGGNGMKVWVWDVGLRGFLSSGVRRVGEGGEVSKVLCLICWCTKGEERSGEYYFVDDGRVSFFLWFVGILAL